MKKLGICKSVLLRIISWPILIILVSGCATTDRRGEIADRIGKLETRVRNLEKSQASIRQTQLRRQYEARVERDRKTFSTEELRQIERLYQNGDRQWGSVEHKQDLKSLVGKYPKANRAGCAMLYLGQMSEGEERVTCFRGAVSEHNDCWYGDGVQVGAYARFYLACDCLQNGNTEEAEKLIRQLKQGFPEAIDHKGCLLTEKISSMTSNADGPDNDER